jgi:hypothetical protein
LGNIKETNIKTSKQRVERTRNLGTETNSEHMGKIRSALRRLSRFWKPALAALKEACRSYTGTNKRMKYEYQCDECKEWKPRKEVQINHKVPCGTLTEYKDVPSFLERLFCEDVSGYNVLCKECHLKETKEQRNDK